MSAQDHLHPAQFFHGTSGSYEFTSGQLLTPGSTPRGMRHMYYTASVATAGTYATYGHPINERGGQDLNAEAVPGHVYAVVPETTSGRKIGKHAVDPDSGLSGNADAYRTKGRLRVLHEVDRDGNPI